MDRFFSALKNAGHEHIIYMQTPQTGVTTVTKGHAHPVKLETAEQVTRDVLGNQTVTSETRYVVLPAGEDMHTHPVAELTVKTPENKKDTRDESDIVGEVYSLREKAKTFDEASRKEAEIDEKYMTEDQWDAAAKAKMEGTFRPALTVNALQAKIKALSGYQRSNRTDFRFRPVESGDTRANDIGNELAKVTCERMNYWNEETECFNSQATVGLGFLYGYIDYERDFRGVPKIIYVDWRKVYLGPHYRKDADDLEFFSIEDVYSAEKVKAMEPSKAAEIEKMFVGGKGFGATGDAKNIYPEGYDQTVVDILNKTIRIIELHRYEYETRYIFIDKSNKDIVLNVTGMDIATLKTIPNVEIVTKSKRKIRMTRVAGTVLLWDGYPELISDEFSLWPIYAEKDREKWRGKVRFARPLCDLNNKYISTGADILNKMNGRGYYIYDSMFKTPEDKEEFKTNVSKPGFVQELEDGQPQPFKEEGVKYPAELERAISFNLQMLDMIMNINPELLGQRGGATSNLMEESRKQSALLGNEFLFDNFSMMKVKIGRWFLHVFQKVYGPERAIRILNNSSAQQDFMVGGVPYSQMDKDALLKLLKDVDFTEYDVIISEVKKSASQKMQNLQLLIEAAKAGMQFPQPLILEYLDITDEQKQKALEYISQQMEAEAAKNNQQSQTEILKTVIAALSKAGIMPGNNQAAVAA